MAGSIQVIPARRTGGQEFTEAFSPYLQQAFAMMMQRKIQEQQRQKNLEQARQVMPGMFQPTPEMIQAPSPVQQYATPQGQIPTRPAIPKQYQFNMQQASQYPGMGINFKTGEMEYKVPQPLTPTYIYDPSTGGVKPMTLPTGEPVPPRAKIITKPVAQEKFEAEQAEKKLKLEEKSQFIRDSAQDSLNTISEIEKGTGHFGLFGQLPSIPGTPRYTWETNINKLLSGKMIDLMTKMKEASKTGATGFGQLSEKEGQILREASTALKRGLAPEKAQEYLNNMKVMLQKVIEGRQQPQGQEDMSQISDEELRRIATGG